jgi:hypothetical protein
MYPNEKRCPIVNSECIKESCMFWGKHPDNECMIIKTYYTINLIKDDYLKKS